MRPLIGQIWRAFKASGVTKLTVVGFWNLERNCNMFQGAKTCFSIVGVWYCTFSHLISCFFGVPIKDVTECCAVQKCSVVWRSASLCHGPWTNAVKGVFGVGVHWICRRGCVAPEAGGNGQIKSTAFEEQYLAFWGLIIICLEAFGGEGLGRNERWKRGLFSNRMTLFFS